MFKKFSSSKYITPENLKIQSLYILLSAIQNLSITEFQLNDFLDRDVFSLDTIGKFQTIEELKNWMKNIVRTIIKLKINSENSEEKNIITEIIDYLEKNYSKEISLQLLSEEFFINPYYLSQLFKAKTGDSYLNYLTSLRINRAKYLLLNTYKKIYTISLEVGYGDTSYFSRLFERNTKYKPSEYRKKYKKK